MLFRYNNDECGAKFMQLLLGIKKIKPSVEKFGYF